MVRSSSRVASLVWRHSSLVLKRCSIDLVEIFTDLLNPAHSQVGDKFQLPIFQVLHALLFNLFQPLSILIEILVKFLFTEFWNALSWALINIFEIYDLNGCAWSWDRRAISSIEPGFIFVLNTIFIRFSIFFISLSILSSSFLLLGSVFCFLILLIRIIFLRVLLQFSCTAQVLLHHIWLLTSQLLKQSDRWA